MPDVDQVVRQTLSRWRTEIATYAKRWLVFTAVAFPILTAYFWWLAPNLKVSLLVTLAAVMSLLIGYVASYLSFLGEYLLARIREIVAEEETTTAALRRLAILGGATSVSALCIGLIVFGSSPSEFLVAGVLLGGTMLLSGIVAQNQRPTRALTAEERDACGRVINHDIDFRTVVGEWGSTPNGFAAATLPSRETVLIHEQAFDQLDDEHVEALAAHELGHIAEHHLPILVVSGTVGTYLVFLSIRAMIRGHLLHLLVFGSATVLAIGLTAHLNRYLEYRADAFAARYLGDVDQVIGDLRAIDENYWDEPVDEGELESSVWTVPKALLRRWYQYKATHPSIDRRIEKLKDRNADQNPSVSESR